MRASKIVLLALVAALLAMAIPLIAASETEARCYPAWRYASADPEEEDIPGGSTAEAEAEVRGWEIGGLCCFHGEVESEADDPSRDIDYISSSGLFYYKTNGSWLLWDSGNENCSDCDEAHWKGGAMYLTIPCWYRTKGYTYFEEGDWSFSPSLEIEHYFPGMP